MNLSSPSKRLASWLPFVAAVGVPLTILGLMGVFSFAQSRHEAELRAQRTAEALAEHALRTFRAHDLIISAVDGHIAGTDPAGLKTQAFLSGTSGRM